MGMVVDIGMLVILMGLGAAALPLILRFMQDHRLTAVNYDQVTIPVGLGLLIWLLHLLQLLLVVGFGAVLGDSSGIQSTVELYFAAVSVVFFAGWLDDTVGDRSVKGWKGHWRKWRVDKVVTTALLKAGGTGCAALLAVYLLADAGKLSLGGAVLQVLLLVLMTNAFNLLDLRPGRAIKTFIVVCTILAIFAAGTSVAVELLLLPSVAGAFVLLPGDLRARHMLGDAGANVLGFSAGCGLIGVAPEWVQAVMVVLLFALHWYAEKHSISTWIDEHRWMSWLDRWGRA